VHAKESKRERNKAHARAYAYARAIATETARVHVRGWEGTKNGVKERERTRKSKRVRL